MLWVVSSLESMGISFCSVFSIKVAWEREKLERSKSTIKYLLEILATFENGAGKNYDSWRNVRPRVY